MWRGLYLHFVGYHSIFERKVSSSLPLLGSSRIKAIGIQVSTSILLVSIGPCAQWWLQLTYLTIIAVPVGGKFLQGHLLL